MLIRFWQLPGKHVIIGPKGLITTSPPPLPHPSATRFGNHFFKKRHFSREKNTLKIYYERVRP
jgi:hypothetical protein